MPPRPFPQLLRLGCDIVQISRIARLITEPLSATRSSFLSKLLTDRELHYLNARFRTTTSASPQRLHSYIAGRWAAKEACIKSVKPRKLTLREVEIWSDESMDTYAIILDPGVSAGSSEGVEMDLGAGRAEVPSHEHVRGQIARVSISHEADYAVAVAMAAPSSGAGDVGGEAAARQPSGA